MYTKIDKNTPAAESESWTIVLMDRASRFIWGMRCGKKDKELFLDAVKILSQLVDSIDGLSLFTDGERSYGNCLFSICQEVVRTEKAGHPKTTLKQGVQVRVKNKVSQTHKPGPKSRENSSAPERAPENKSYY